MRYVFKQFPTGIKTFITRPVVGISYLGNTQVYYGQEGPVTVAEMYVNNPDMFRVIDTLEIKTQIIVNLTSQYEYLHKYYGGNLTDDAMANKISDLAEKICSKI